MCTVSLNIDVWLLHFVSVITVGALNIQSFCVGYTRVSTHERCVLGWGLVGGWVGGLWGLGELGEAGGG